jgi:hypothetical protein
VLWVSLILEIIEENSCKKAKKNQGWGTHPSIKSTRQMRTQVDTTQRKNKSKTINRNISGKDLMQRELMTTK